MAAVSLRGISVQLDLSPMLFCMGKGRECTGALLGEGQDEDSPASGQHGSCSGGEGGGDPCVRPSA